MKKFLGRSITSRQELILEMQRDAIEEKFGSMDEYFFDAGVSGGAKLDAREALLECISSLKKNDVIYIYSWSRLARDVFIHLWVEDQVKEKKAFIVSLEDGDTINDTAEKKMMRVIMAAAAELQKAQIKMAVASARKTMRKQGKFLGGTRQYGYTIIGGELKPVENEQNVIRSMVGWKNDGKTIRDITATLNANDIPSCTGKEWHYMSVRKILQREV